MNDETADPAPLSLSAQATRLHDARERVRTAKVLTPPDHKSTLAQLDRAESILTDVMATLMQHR